MNSQVVPLSLAITGLILLLCALAVEMSRARAMHRDIAAMTAEAHELKVIIVEQDDRLIAQQHLLRAAATAMEEVVRADHQAARTPQPIVVHIEGAMPPAPARAPAK